MTNRQIENAIDRKLLQFQEGKISQEDFDSWFERTITYVRYSEKQRRKWTHYAYQSMASILAIAGAAVSER